MGDQNYWLWTEPVKVSIGESPFVDEYGGEQPEAGTTIIYVTHQMEEVESCAIRCFIERRSSGDATAIRINCGASMDDILSKFTAAKRRSWAMSKMHNLGTVSNSRRLEHWKKPTFWLTALGFAVDWRAVRHWGHKHDYWSVKNHKKQEIFAGSYGRFEVGEIELLAAIKAKTAKSKESRLTA